MDPIVLIHKIIHGVVAVFCLILACLCVLRNHNCIKFYEFYRQGVHMGQIGGLYGRDPCQVIDLTTMTLDDVATYKDQCVIAHGEFTINGNVSINPLPETLNCRNVIITAQVQTYNPILVSDCWGLNENCDGYDPTCVHDWTAHPESGGWNIKYEWTPSAGGEARETTDFSTEKRVVDGKDMAGVSQGFYLWDKLNDYEGDHRDADEVVKAFRAAVVARWHEDYFSWEQPAESYLFNYELNNWSYDTHYLLKTIHFNTIENLQISHPDGGLTLHLDPARWRKWGMEAWPEVFPSYIRDVLDPKKYMNNEDGKNFWISRYGASNAGLLWAWQWTYFEPDRIGGSMFGDERGQSPNPIPGAFYSDATLDEKRQNGTRMSFGGHSSLHSTNVVYPLCIAPSIHDALIANDGKWTQDEFENLAEFGDESVFPDCMKKEVPVEVQNAGCMRAFIDDTPLYDIGTVRTAATCHGTDGYGVRYYLGELHESELSDGTKVAILDGWMDDLQFPLPSPTEIYEGQGMNWWDYKIWESLTMNLNAHPWDLDVIKGKVQSVRGWDTYLYPQYSALSIWSHLDSPEMAHGMGAAWSGAYAGMVTAIKKMNYMGAVGWFVCAIWFASFFKSSDDKSSAH